MSSEPEELVQFWFSPEVKARWFDSTPEFDAELRERFLGDWEAARDGLHAHWEQAAIGALALVILLDQIPLNIFRDNARRYSTAESAREVADRATARGFDQELDDEQKGFLYLPYMHSERLEDQERSVALCQSAGLEDSLKWALHHRDVIRRFGRFPHRNRILGRDSTPEERAWLATSEGFSG